MKALKCLISYVDNLFSFQGSASFYPINCDINQLFYINTYQEDINEISNSTSVLMPEEHSASGLNSIARVYTIITLLAFGHVYFTI